MNFFSLLRKSKRPWSTLVTIVEVSDRDGLGVKIGPGPPEPDTVYATTAALPMHAHSVFAEMLVREFQTLAAIFWGLYLSAK